MARQLAFGRRSVVAGGALVGLDGGVGQLVQVEDHLLLCSERAAWTAVALHVTMAIVEMLLQQILVSCSIPTQGAWIGFVIMIHLDVNR